MAAHARIDPTLTELQNILIDHWEETQRPDGTYDFLGSLVLTAKALVAELERAK